VPRSEPWSGDASESPLTDLPQYPWLNSSKKKLLSVNYTHHCLLISGAAGLGKSILALELAERLLCENLEGEDSCGRCSSCHLVSNSVHPQLHVLIPESLIEKSHPIARVHAQRYLDPGRSTQKRKLSEQISVDSARLLAETLLTTVATNSRKVVLIIGADAMNRNAANAMLKVLEEPTDRTQFILVSSYPYRLPATIHSRCIRLDSPAPSKEETARWLQSQHDINSEDLAVLFRSGLGPLELSQLIGNERTDTIGELIRCCKTLNGKVVDPITLATLCTQIGIGRALLILQSAALVAIREAVRADSSSNAGSGGLFGCPKRALEAFQRLGVARERFNGPVDEQLGLEDICAWLCSEAESGLTRTTG
jgi:DNA polymerase-3 subunit delta'